MSQEGDRQREIYLESLYREYSDLSNEAVSSIKPRIQKLAETAFAGSETRALEFRIARFKNLDQAMQLKASHTDQSE